MFNKFCLQKKKITKQEKGSKRSKQIYLVYNPTKRVRIDSNGYKPFVNLALCPKQVIAFVQDPNFDFQNLENTIQNLKMPSAIKRKETLYKMRKLADKQEEFKNLIIQGSQGEEVKQKKRSQDTMSEVSDKSHLITEYSQSSSYQTKINPKILKNEGLEIHQRNETPQNNTFQTEYLFQKNQIKECRPLDQVIQFDQEQIISLDQQYRDGQFIHSPQQVFSPLKNNFYNIDHEDYFQFKVNNERIQNDFDNFIYF